MSKAVLTVRAHNHVKAMVLVEVGYTVAVEAGRGGEMPGVLEGSIGRGIYNGDKAAADLVGVSMGKGPAEKHDLRGMSFSQVDRMVLNFFSFLNMFSFE